MTATITRPSSTTLPEGTRIRILVIEDDPEALALLQALLDTQGYAVDVADTGEEGLEAIDREVYDVVLLDLHLPGVDGLEVLRRAQSAEQDPAFIMITGDRTIDRAVEAMRLGAFDFITKPLRTDALLLDIQRACEKSQLQREVAQLRRRAKAGARSHLIGKSPAIERMFDMIERVAPMNATVLITGETGTGKELAARAIHELSPRRTHPFVPVQCSALSPTLLESELFGHVKGSFTGAVTNRRGLFEEASTGTLFLDEIGTIPPEIQVKILRVIQDRKIQRVGSNESIPVQFRLIGATNLDLSEEVEKGNFREDLFYRLNVFPIHVPPLRERRDDVPLLASAFRERFGKENGVAPPEIAPATMASMMAHDWPGNVRELENFIERALIMYADAPAIRFEPPQGSENGAEAGLLAHGAQELWDLARLEREYIFRILDSTDGHHGKAARRLGIARRTLHRKLKRYREESPDDALVG